MLIKLLQGAEKVLGSVSANRSYSTRHALGAQLFESIAEFRDDLDRRKTLLVS
jgi:hypothetical protein